MRQPRVEILYVEGCPHLEPARALVEQVAAELDLQPQVEMISVPDAEAAATLWFLGSPTVRVDGRDVEPGAYERREFVLSCRVYRSEHGFSGQPDEAWIRDALARGHVSARPARPATVLTAAGIPSSKLGHARHARLSELERELYFWILRRFATTGRPTSGETRAAAERLGLEVDETLATLSREDLVHRHLDGEIAVAYPFSGRLTAHRVRFPSGHEVDAMCALDALGIAPMFEQTIEIFSRDPLSGEAIRVELEPDGTGSWRPDQAVVVAGRLDAHADSCGGCCPVLNFFASPASAERWLSQHREVRGHVISVEEAIASGRAVFARVFEW